VRARTRPLSLILSSLGEIAVMFPVIFCFLFLGILPTFAGDKYAPVEAEVIDETVDGAKAAGEAQAAMDIAARKFQILDWGLPHPPPWPLRYDRETGFVIYTLSNCIPTSPFLARVTAYNAVMRKWHAEHKK
jgi:hypothetical protein